MQKQWTNRRTANKKKRTYALKQPTQNIQRVNNYWNKTKKPKPLHWRKQTCHVGFVQNGSCHITCLFFRTYLDSYCFKQNTSIAICLKGFLPYLTPHPVVARSAARPGVYIYIYIYNIYFYLSMYIYTYICVYIHNIIIYGCIGPGYLWWRRWEITLIWNANRIETLLSFEICVLVSRHVFRRWPSVFVLRKMIWVWIPLD